MNPGSGQLRAEGREAYCVGYTTMAKVTPELLSRAFYGDTNSASNFTFALDTVRGAIGDNWNPNDMANHSYWSGPFTIMMNWSYLLTNKYNPGGISQTFESDDSARMIGYMLKLMQTGQQVPIVGLWRANEPPRGTNGACGNPHPGTPNADLGGAHMILIPVRGEGGALSNPNMWRGVGAWNVGSPSGGSNNLFFSFERATVGQSGMTGTLQAVQVNTGNGLISTNNVTGVLISNGGSGGAGGQPETPTHTGRTIKASFINAATIQLEYDMDGKHVVEKYVDRKWDSLSFYFLTTTTGHPDPNRSSYTWDARAGATGIGSDIDPYCDTRYTPTDMGVPFIALPSNFADVGGGGGSQHCDDYARGLIDISYDDGDGTTPLQTKAENLGKSFDGHNPRFFDYPIDPTGWGYESSVRGTSDGNFHQLPLGEDLTGPTKTLEQSIWFYVVAEAALDPAQWEAISVWQDADSTQANFTVGSYTYSVPGSTFTHAGSGCTNSTLSPAGMSTGTPQNYLAGNPHAWVLDWKLANQNCSNPAWRQAVIIGKVITQAELGGIITAPQDSGGVVQGDTCNQEAGVFGWVICPSTSLFADMAEKIDGLILGFIKIDVGTIFDAGADNNYFRIAWILFRNIAYALLVILGLIMVVSQVAGLDLFDAYTIKKMLPKLVAAAIIIPLLWPSLEVITRMANDSAGAIEQLIKGPFQINESSAVVDWLTATGLITGGVVAAGAFIALGGWTVALALVASVALAILQAAVVIAARDIVFYVLVIASPVAVVLAIFEPFKKGFDLWRRLLTGILLSIPAVAAVLAGSKVGATVSRTTEGAGVLFEITFIVVGYLMFWPILKSMDKVAGQIDGMADKVTSGAQKALSKFRGETMKRRWNEFRTNQRGDLDTQGYRWKGVSWGTRAASLFNPSRMIRSAARQANILEAAAQPGVGYKDARHGAAARAHEFRNAQKLLKDAQDHGEATSGNSQLNQAIAEEGKRRDDESKKEYHERVAARMASYARTAHVIKARDAKVKAGESFTEQDQADAEAEFDEKHRATVHADGLDAVKQAESDYKVEAGSSTFHLIGLMAAGADNTAWRAGDFADEGEARERFVAAIASAVDNHSIDEVMGAKILTQNKARLDLAGGGFGAAMGYVKGARKGSIAAGAAKADIMADVRANNPGMSEADLQVAAAAEYRRREAATYDFAIRQGNSAQQVFAQRWETARTEATKMKADLELLSDAAHLDMLPVLPDGSLDTGQVSQEMVTRMTGIAQNLGLDLSDTGGDPARIHQRVKTYMDAERSRRNLAYDRNGRPLSSQEAMTRQLALVSSAYQYMMHFAPQNEQYVSDILISTPISVPVSYDTGEPVFEADGVTQRTAPARIPTGRTQAVTRPDPADPTRTITETIQVTVPDPDDPTGVRQIPEFRTELRPLTRRGTRTETMSVADAMDRARTDPQLREIMRLHGFDPYAGRFSGDPSAAGDPMATSHPPVLTP